MIDKTYCRFIFATCNKLWPVNETAQKQFNIKTMTINEQFDQAVLDSKSLSQKPANDVLLQMYSLFKQSTEGDVNTEAPTNMFDFVNKAKHEAWSSLKGKSSEEAMEEYVNLVNKLKGA